MSKETVVRQNRCDEEMRFLLFCCFSFYMAVQVLAGAKGQSDLADTLSQVLYIVFVPGFLFYLGYCYNRLRRMNSEEYRKKWLGRTAVRYYVYFFLLTFAHELQPFLLDVAYPGGRYLILSAFSDVLSLLCMPAVSAMFFTMALTLALARVFDNGLSGILRNKKQMVILGIICLLCTFLRSKQEAYPIVAALFGAESPAAVPGVPYFAFFLIGAWFEDRKPGFQWKTGLIAAVVTAVSVLLYRTPARQVCQVMISCLPVYLVYVVAEGLSELTLRFGLFRSACRLTEPVFCVYGTLVMLLGAIGQFTKMSVLWAALAAAALILLIYAGIFVTWLIFRGYAIAAARLQERTRRRTAVYFVIYTLVFAILLVLVFAVFLIHGKTLLWRNDTVAQYYPRAVYFANYIRELLSNFLHGNFELPMYDFRFGMGSEVVYSMEPLYFLVALFGAGNVEFTHTFLILVRFYLAGITSSVFFLYYKKDYFTTFLSSVVYVFCGFSLFGGARHPMFMVPMIFLPLLIISIEEILRGRRWYLCTILVALSMFSNYYFLYMSTFGMGFYFIVRYFCRKEKKSLAGFIGKGLVISGSYLMGVAMSCIILVSNFGLYVGSSRSGGAIIKTPSLFFYCKDWLLRIFLSFPTTANSPGDWLRLGFLPISFFAVIFLFLRKGRKELKVLSVITVIGMALPLSGFVLGGFSAITYRWCYMAALLVAYIMADCLPDMYRMTRKELIICAVGVGLYGYFAILGNYMENGYTKLAFACLCATFVVLLLIQENVKKLSRYGKQCLLVLLTFIMVFEGGFTLFQVGSVADEYTAPGEAMETVQNTPLIAVEEVGDDSFYRVGSPKLSYYTISSSIMFDYNSIYMFNSTMNGSIMEYLEKMGVSGYSATQFMGFNNRQFMNELAAVKYYAYYANNKAAIPAGFEEVLRTEANGKETVISENRYALPLGYTYTDAITEEELEQYDVHERQEVLMQKVMLDDAEAIDSLQKPQGEDLVLTAQPLKISSVKEKGIRLTETALIAGDGQISNGMKAVYGQENETDNEDSASGNTKYKLKVKFKKYQPKSELYVVLKNAFIEGDMSETSIKLTFEVEGAQYGFKFRPDDDRYGSQQQDYVFNLGYYEDAVKAFTLEMDREGTVQFDSLELYCQPMDNLEQYTQALTEDILENVVIDTNCVSGDITLEEDKILVLSIPYQNGWTAYVDGEPVKLQRANYMYMALPLEAGNHTIKLTFAIPGIKYALVIMPGAVVLFIILCFVTWLYRRKKGKMQSIS